MKGDFARRTFDPRLNFSRVLMQQGRVMVEADWNEQVGILLHNLRTFIADFAGPAVPIGDAFKIEVTDEDFTISPGHIYVDGILCVNDDETASYLEQPYLPEPKTGFSGSQLVYLDVWERHLTHVQAPAIREVALGGPDTASRAKVIWQVRLHSDADVTCEYVTENWSDFVNEWQPRFRGALAARAHTPDTGPDNPCILPPTARYRGDSNRLYRVEVHSGGSAGTATFKWSRENGAVVLPVVLSGELAHVESLGTDDRHAVNVGDWVEILDDHIELRGEPGVLAEVEVVDAVARTLKLSAVGGSIPDFPDDGSTHPILRRWDYRHGRENGGEEGADGAIKIEEGVWIRLEDGVEVEFAPRQEEPLHLYRTGDYWLIPARTETGDVEWPRDGGDPAAVEPDGIDHHYAPVAVRLAGSVDVTDCLANRRHVSG
jgi:hypothetical protein